MFKIPKMHGLNNERNQRVDRAFSDQTMKNAVSFIFFQDIARQNGRFDFKLRTVM